MARILVIEDHPVNLKLVRFILESAGHQVVGAGTAAEGLALAREAPQPETILMDIQLPGMDGLAATRLLKGDPVTAHIPVIALTAFAMTGDEGRILGAGCDGYVAKPFHHAQLVSTVAAALSPRRAALDGDAHAPLA